MAGTGFESTRGKTPHLRRARPKDQRSDGKKLYRERLGRTLVRQSHQTRLDRMQIDRGRSPRCVGLIVFTARDGSRSLRPGTMFANRRPDFAIAAHQPRWQFYRYAFERLFAGVRYGVAKCSGGRQRRIKFSEIRDNGRR